MKLELIETILRRYQEEMEMNEIPYEGKEGIEGRKRVFAKK
jgi:hypothetical protein